MKIIRDLLSVSILISIAILPKISRAYGELPFQYQALSAMQAPHRALKDSIYFGGGLGLDSYYIHQTVELIDRDGGLVDVSTSMLSRGAVGKVFLGYGQYFCWFYFAGELFAKYTTAENTFGILAYHSNISVRSSVGASLIPGIKISPCTLIYARIGYDRTKFKIFERGTLLGDDSRRQWSNGVDIGLGIEEAITSRFSFRAEYTFSNYNDFRTEFNTKFLPKDNAISLDFIYHLHFCV